MPVTSLDTTISNDSNNRNRSNNSNNTINSNNINKVIIRDLRAFSESLAVGAGPCLQAKGMASNITRQLVGFRV